MAGGYSPLADPGPQKTELHCHECDKHFVAELDYRISGNHIIECPRCGHEHCRVIQDGKITAERWNHRLQRVDVDKRSVWSASVIQPKFSTVSEHLRAAWLNRSDLSL